MFIFKVAATRAAQVGILRIRFSRGSIHQAMKTKSLTILSAAVLVSTFATVAQILAQQASLGAPLAKEAVLSALTSKVDTKKSKVGDTVSAKTLNPLQLTDGTTLPSGTKLVGKVTQVQPKSSGTATIAIVFTELDKKGEAPMQVHGVLAAVAPEPNLSDSGGGTNDLPMGSGGNKGQTAAMTGSGVNAGGGATPSIQPGSSIKGVTLNTTPAADGSSVLQSTDKDFKLDNGTRLEIGLTSAQ
jgi:hypothetical protein